MDALDNRKKKILKTVIKTYLETGEPVGSRTISKMNELNVSPATIRNEMADLEEMGYLIQPHTSSGRIPTDKGYRFYVDELMEEKEQRQAARYDFMNARMDRVENVLENMAKMLAANTNYAAMIAAPRFVNNEVKLIQLSRLDARHLIAVIVVEGNAISNKVIPIDAPVSNEDLLKLNVLLNSALQGKTLDDITLKLMRELNSQAGEYSTVVANVLQAVSDAISESRTDQPEVYTSGTTNIFKYPELAESSSARDILTTFEDKKEMLDLFSVHEQQDGNGIQVYIGNETPIRSMKNCSVVTATYDLGKGLTGTIGIVGPKRMDYDHVFGTLRSLMEQLDSVYHKNV